MIASDFRKYADLIAGVLAPERTFCVSVENADSLQVERGEVFAAALMRPESPIGQSIERVFALAKSPRLGNLLIVDASGHNRPVYRGLLAYCCLSTFRLVYEKLSGKQFGRWEEGLRPWCDRLEYDIANCNWPAMAMPASRGSVITEAVWMALALHVAGKVFIRDAWTDLAADTFGRLCRCQRPSGAFLAATNSDNPETHWYHELVTLHAAASYAVQTEDRAVALAVQRNTEFHLNETQPDHASNHPWAVFAFLWNPNTRILADGLLHTAAVHSPGRQDGISLMLLADALYCLRRFL